MEYLLLVVAYIIGSIPFSYLFGKKFKNKDLRDHGSGNLGTTNAFRVLGKAIGIIVLILDISKSGLLVLLVKLNPDLFGLAMLHPIFYGGAAILGHVFPPWFNFKGGKGVASSLGVIAVYAPWIGITLIPFFFFIVGVTKFVSLGSTATAMVVSLMSIILFFNTPADSLYDLEFMLVASGASLLIFIRHKQNFIKIANGTENKSHIFSKPK